MRILVAVAPALPILLSALLQFNGFHPSPVATVECVVATQKKNIRLEAVASKECRLIEQCLDVGEMRSVVSGNKQPCRAPVQCRAFSNILHEDRMMFVLLHEVRMMTKKEFKNVSDIKRVGAVFAIFAVAAEVVELERVDGPSVNLPPHHHKDKVGYLASVTVVLSNEIAV